jgi:hypothetical protein
MVNPKSDSFWVLGSGLSKYWPKLQGLVRLSQKGVCRLSWIKFWVRSARFVGVCTDLAQKSQNVRGRRQNDGVGAILARKCRNGIIFDPEVMKVPMGAGW